MSRGRKRLGELLVSNKLLSIEQLNEALSLQQRESEPLGQILIDHRYITEERLLQVCAMQRGVRAWFLHTDPPTAEAISLLPGVLCRSRCMLPVLVQNGRLLLAMRETDDFDDLDMVRNITNLRVEPVLANEARLVSLIETVYGEEKDSIKLKRLVNDAMVEIRSDPAELLENAAAISEAEMRPVVGLVNQILIDAVRMRASDIHVEPRKNRVEVRYRVDGQLQRMHELPSKLQAALIARLKIMATLDIVEYRIPQDGRLSYVVDGRTIDFRVSVLPNYHGQRVVLRVLDKNIALKKMVDIGFSQHNYHLFENMIQKPYGLILVTGPTGSGKTTTLYAAINQLKTETSNIMTCEDPVEYDVDGINQSQVNEKVGLTFATQLRSILRQDPDIVLVGEIRDQETAEIAIRAALTGHLVLSTLHCNDALSAIPRLTDMGIEPFLLSTALIGVMAQRLVRVLCPHCRENYVGSEEEKAMLAPHFDEVPMLWRAQGCAQCGNTGYRGRSALHEVLPVTTTVQHSIAAREPMDQLRELARQHGYIPMHVDACDRIRDGQTSLFEARRVVYFETPEQYSPPVLRIA